MFDKKLLITLTYAISYPTFIIGVFFVGIKLANYFGISPQYVIIILVVLIFYPLFQMVKSVYKRKD